MVIEVNKTNYYVIKELNRLTDFIINQDKYSANCTIQMVKEDEKLIPDLAKYLINDKFPVI